ncbi:Uncharacterised protein [Enterobacter hormaechei]|nr:Uncharacterised protein [Enterobacter hormaechei]SAC02205.1 Uncharacterised protein [Enterobacter hormaechei]SAI28906.1 Uncharacterised protein [Enterobacter hormaechei]SAI91239.1 Uncharacterised protein [Enterobacter hormaechei]SAI99240.1 Uncharacterised protein [Enterobacter hormaechei]
MGQLVNGVGVGDEIVDGYLRHGGIHQPNAVRAAAVARHVTDGGRHGDIAIGQRAYVGGRHVQLPATVRLYRGLVRFTVQRHGDRLARFSGCAAAEHQILLRFCRINDVVVGQVIKRNGWRLRIDDHHA